jgi:pimeloyl-ACP methyl ester carboxylesterase
MAPDAELDPTRFRVRFSASRGFRIAFVDEGSGPALLLVHGWPETKRIWWRNVAPLARAGFRVIAPDLRGFGESDVARRLRGRRRTAAISRRSSTSSIATCVPIAGDLGGAVIQDFAQRFPARRAPGDLQLALPFLKDKMAGLRTRPAVEAADYYPRRAPTPTRSRASSTPRASAAATSPSSTARGSGLLPARSRRRTSTS